MNSGKGTRDRAEGARNPHRRRSIRQQKLLDYLVSRAKRAGGRSSAIRGGTAGGAGHTVTSESTTRAALFAARLPHRAVRISLQAVLWIFPRSGRSADIGSGVATSFAVRSVSVTPWRKDGRSFDPAPRTPLRYLTNSPTTPPSACRSPAISRGISTQPADPACT